SHTLENTRHIRDFYAAQPAVDQLTQWQGTTALLADRNNDYLDVQSFREEIERIASRHDSVLWYLDGAGKISLVEPHHGDTSASQPAQGAIDCHRVFGRAQDQYPLLERSGM